MNYLNTMAKVIDIPQLLIDYINSLSGLNIGDDFSDDEINTFIDTVCPDEQTFCKFIIYIDALKRIEDPFQSVIAIHLRALNTMNKYKTIVNHVLRIKATDPMKKIWDDYCRDNFIMHPSRY